jgi:hypothetical protein
MARAFPYLGESLIVEGGADALEHGLHTRAGVDAPKATSCLEALDDRQ